MLRVTKIGFSQTCCRNFGGVGRDLNNSFFFKSTKTTSITKKDVDAKKPADQKIINVTNRNNKVEPSEPQRLDEIHFKHHIKPIIKYEQQWKDIQKCSRASKFKVTERDIQQQASKVYCKRSNDNLVNGGYLGAAVKLAKTSGPQSSKQSKKEMHSKEVEKTHYDEKVNVRKPNGNDANFNGRASTLEKKIDGVNSRFDRTHLKYCEELKNSAVSLADYYKDLLIGGKLANIRVRQPGYNERSYSWYAKGSTQNLNYTKPSTPNRTVPKRCIETSSSQGKKTSKLVKSTPFNFKPRY